MKRVDVRTWLRNTTLFSAASLVVLRWFSGWNYIHQIDGRFKLNPMKYLYSSIYFWKDGSGLGAPSPDFLSIPFYLIHSLLLKVLEPAFGYWKSLVVSQFMIMYLIVFFGFVFAWLFFREFLKTFFNKPSYDDSGPKTVLLLYTLAFLYNFNLFSLTIVYARFTGWTFTWIALPLVGFLYIRYLQSGNTKYLVILGIASLMSPLISGGFAFPNLPLLMLVLLVLTVALVLTDAVRKKQYAVKSCVFITTFLLLNAWTLIPQIIGMQSMASSAELTLGATADTILQYASKFASISNILRFLGYYGLGALWSTPQYGDFPFVWVPFYRQSAVIQIMTYVYPLVIAVSLLLIFKEKEIKVKRTYIFLFVILLILVVIMKGTNEPLSATGFMLLRLNSVFFRHPYTRFVHAFAFLFFLILLYLLAKLSIFIRKSLNYSVVIGLLIIVFLIPSYPLLTGDVIHPFDRIDLSHTRYAKLDEDIKAKHISDLDKSRVIVLPFTTDSTESSYLISGRVNHPNNKPVLYSMISDSKILQFPNSSQDNKLLHMLFDAMSSNDTKKFIQTVKLFNIEYVALHKDTTERLIIGSQNLKSIKMAPRFTERLVAEHKINKIFENDNISFYRINNGVERVLPIVFLLRKQQPPITIEDLISKSASHQKDTQVSVQTINPNRYAIKINTTKPFYLVLNEAFDTGWQAFRSDDSSKAGKSVISEMRYLFEKPLSEKKHLSIQGYANAWYVDPKGKSNFSMTLYFMPQTYFYIGLMVSGLGFLGCLIAWFYQSRQKSMIIAQSEF